MDKEQLRQGAAVFRTISLMIKIAPEAAITLLLELKKVMGYSFLIQREPPSIEFHSPTKHVHTFEGDKATLIFDFAESELGRVNKHAETKFLDTEIVQAFCMFHIARIILEEEGVILE